jgi:hypothetical protein
MERLQQRANEGHHLPRSVGIPRAGARRLESLEYPRQELLLFMTLMGNFVRMSENHAAFTGCKRANGESGREVREGLPRA